MSNIIENIIKPQRLSVSKTKCFDACKKQFQFNYIFKLPQKDQKHLTFGKFLHRVLELFYQRQLEGPISSPSKEMGIAFKTSLEEFRGTISKEAQKEAYEIIDQYLKKLSTTEGLVGNVLAVEKKFTIPLNDKVVITGMIDRLEMDKNGTIFLSDYKSTKNKKYLENDLFQLLTYAWVVLQEHKDLDRIKTAYILLRHNFEHITKEFTKEEILTIPQKYIQYAEQMERETEYKANPTVLCNWCSYLDKCDEGKKFLGIKELKIGKTSWK